MLHSVIGVISCVFTLCYCQSPCPSFFKYMIHDRTKEIYGKIEIPFPPKQIVLQLRVSLSVATALPTRYAGKIELAKSKRQSIEDINNNQPLIYNIFFPVARPLPLLTEILFNDHQYCIGAHAMGPAVTNIILEHFLYPPIIDESSNQKQEDKFCNNNSMNATFTNTHVNNDIKNNTIKMISTLNTFSNNDNICGESNYDDNTYDITENGKTWPGQWPWLAAIFIVRLKFQFQCVGNLITDKHILTAGHCKYFNGQELHSNNFIASLGRYQLNNWREKSSRNVEIREFFIHPDYENQGSAHADLALILLQNKIQFTPTIKPACLWSGSSDLNAIVGKDGYVIGWGRNNNNNQHVGELRMAKVPIISQEQCLRSNIAFLYSTSNKTFCAGNKDGNGPCNGDSGSGLVMFNKLNGKYHLRGIVSLSLLNRSTSLCNLSEYIVYVDVAKFLDWIINKIKTN